jgi:hypothetical protein
MTWRELLLGASALREGTHPSSVGRRVVSTASTENPVFAATNSRSPTGMLFAMNVPEDARRGGPGAEPTSVGGHHSLKRKSRAIGHCD